MDSLPPNWRYFEITTSTNDTIHEAAAAGALEGTVHLAGCQTQGRGRAGRVWWSPPGAGLWMSLLLRPAVAVQDAAGISLLAGKAVKHALQDLIPRSLELHWPNDIYIAKKKLAGILGELRSQGDRYWIALGIGVNLDLRKAELPPILEGRVISLAEAGCRELAALNLGRRIADAFWPLYHRYLAGECLVRIIGGDLARIGKRVEIRPVPSGSSSPETCRAGEPAASWRGAIAGLGESGELLVEAADGVIRQVTGGEVIYDDQ